MLIKLTLCRIAREGSIMWILSVYTWLPYTIGYYNLNSNKVIEDAQNDCERWWIFVFTIVIERSIETRPTYVRNDNTMEFFLIFYLSLNFITLYYIHRIIFFLFLRASRRHIFIIFICFFFKIFKIILKWYNNKVANVRMFIKSKSLD